MNPEYQAYRQELLDKALSYYKQPVETISIPYLLKGKCGSWAKKFEERFPELSYRRGFYGHNEHCWCVTSGGTIVDPTIQQFYIEVGDPSMYREFNPEVDEIYLGKCMNCGNEIYGLESKGPQNCCEDIIENGVVVESCAASLDNYFNSEIERYRA